MGVPCWGRAFHEVRSGQLNDGPVGCLVRGGDRKLIHEGACTIFRPTYHHLIRNESMRVLMIMRRNVDPGSCSHDQISQE
jgi:hypothetical protein